MSTRRSLGQERGARIITPPTEFFGGIFSRMLDPWRNGWWVYDIPSDEADDDAAASWEDEAGTDSGNDGWGSPPRS